MSLKEKLAEDLKSSMKNKDTVRKNTVQLVRTAILQVEKDNKVTLDDEDILEVIKTYEQKIPPLKAIHLPQNVGHGEARRICLKNCSHQLIALMDADDICTCDRFEKQLKLFSDSEDLAVVGGQIYEFTQSTEKVVGKRIVPLEDQEIKEYAKIRCPMNQVTVMFRKDAVEDAGGYLDWFCEEDYYLWLRMIQKGYRFHNLPDCLVFVRVGEDMYRRRGGLQYFKSERKLQKYMLGIGFIPRSTYLLNVIKRLIVQVFLPNRLRGLIFQKIARSN